MTPKDKFAIQQLLEIDNVNYLIDKINTINQSFIHLIESLYINTPKLKDGEVFIETLSMRIALTSKSIISLSNGFFLNTHEKVGINKVVDFPSINILARSIIESFLTLEYLFYNELEDKEREFRFLIWRISGYKARQNFFSNRELKAEKNIVKEKLDDERREIQDLLKKIEEFEYYKVMKSSDLWKLDKFGVPRLKSWNDLLENSVLKDDIFITPYKLYSNYAHSEFISLIQINGKDNLTKGSELNTLHLKNVLRIILMLNCVGIIELKQKFANSNSAYDDLPEKEREIIEFWNFFARENKHYS